MLKKLKGTSIKKILDTQEIFAIKGVGGGGVGGLGKSVEKGNFVTKIFSVWINFLKCCHENFCH